MTQPMLPALLRRVRGVIVRAGDRIASILISRAGVLAAGRAAASVLAAVWLIVVARATPLVDFGEVTVALSLVFVLGAFSDLGLQILLARDVVESGAIDRRVLHTVIRRRFVSAVVAGAVLVVLYEFATRSRDALLPVIFGLSLLTSAVYAPSIAAYRARGYVALETLVESIGRLLMLALLVPLFSLHPSARSAAASYSSVNVAIAVLVYIRVRRRSVMRSEEVPPPRVHWSAALPFALASTAGVVYQRIDQYLVAVIGGTAQAGLYGASYRLQDANLLAPMALGQLAIADPAARSVDARRAIAVRVALQSAMIAAVPAILVSLFARQLMVILFGAAFQSTGPTVIVLMLSTIPGAVAAALATIAAISDPRAFAWASAASLAVNVAINLALLPIVGIVGAACANVGSQIVLALGLAWTIRRGNLRSGYCG